MNHRPSVAFLSMAVLVLLVADCLAQAKATAEALYGHKGEVSSIAISPDGKHIVSGGKDKIVRVWNTTTKKVVKSLTGHDGAVLTVAFSPDGKQVVSGDEIGMITIWNAETGEKIYTLKNGKPPVKSVTFSRSGKFLFSAGGGPVIQAWNVSTGEPDKRTLSVNQGRVTCMSLSVDGKHLSVGTASEQENQAGQIKVFELANGRELVTFSGAPGAIHSVAFSPDGSMLACASDGDSVSRSELRVWAMNDGASPTLLSGHTGAIHTVTFSPDGKRLVSGGADKIVRMWDGVQGSLIGTFAGHGDSINCVQFNRDGNSIVSGSSDGTLRIWDVAKATPPAADTESPKSSLAEAMASIPALGGGMAVQNLAQPAAKPPGGTPLLTMANTNGSSSALYSRDSKQILVGGLKIVKLFDADKGTEIRSFDQHARYVSSHVALSSDGTRCASAGADGIVRVWNMETGKELHALKDQQSNAFAGVAFSANSKQVAAVANGKDLVVSVWDASSASLLHTLKLDGAGGRASRVAFSPDGKLIASNYFTMNAGVVVVWELATKKPKFLSGHVGSITSLAFSPDGKRLVSTGWEMRDEIKVWDVVTGTQLTKLKGHISPVMDATFSPDGKKIVSSGADHLLKVWDVETGAEIGTIAEPRNLPFASATFSPDGKRIVSTTGNDAQVWNVVDAKPIPKQPEVTNNNVPARNSQGGVTIKGSPRAMQALRKFQEQAAAKDGITLPPGDGPVVIEDGKMRSSQAPNLTESTPNRKPPDITNPTTNPQSDSNVSAIELALKGDWTRSKISFAREFKGKQIENGETGFEYAAVALMAGDESAYRTICYDLFARSGTQGIRPYHAARSCTLTPYAFTNMAELQIKANMEIKDSNEFWALTENGAIAFRSGRLDEAADLFLRSLKAESLPGAAVVNWLWLSLVESRRGNKSEANNWFVKATTFMDKTSNNSTAYRKDVDRNVDGLHHHNWFEALVLRKEAQKLLEKK
jgi:WD40 repeat protein